MTSLVNWSIKPSIYIYLPSRTFLTRVLFVLCLRTVASSSLLVSPWASLVFLACPPLPPKRFIPWRVKCLGCGTCPALGNECVVSWHLILEGALSLLWYVCESSGRRARLCRGITKAKAEYCSSFHKSPVAEVSCSVLWSGAISQGNEAGEAGMKCRKWEGRVLWMTKRN